ncbi:GDSL-type esterase/lipase family protein [Micromonospora sp. SD12]|uniref:GDSL-type esterase/lipase family protein n=1 Tax=Micromonospora sp. SD12 TaxID=3452216 RepID=UPI003F892EC4
MTGGAVRLEPPPSAGSGWRRLALTDDRLEIVGAVSTRHGPGGLQPWRLQHRDLDLYHPSLLGPGACPAGVRLRLRCDTTRLRLRLAASESVPGPHPRVVPLCDLAVDGELRTTRAMPPSGEIEFGGLDGTTAGLEVWLPTAPALRIISVEVDRGARVDPLPPDRQPGWAVYGSSLTHGVGLSPARTWTALAARAAGRRSYCLGYDGGAHLDPQVAAAIGELPVEVITLEIGINVHLAGSFTGRTFAPAVHGFLDRIRLHQPAAPVVVVPPLLSPAHEATQPEHGLALAEIRAQLAQVVELRRRRGDAALHQVATTDLLDDPALFPDGLHLSAAGHRELARRYLECESRLFDRPGPTPA